MRMHESKYSLQKHRIYPDAHPGGGCPVAHRASLTLLLQPEMRLSDPHQGPAAAKAPEITREADQAVHDRWHVID